LGALERLSTNVANPELRSNEAPGRAATMPECGLPMVLSQIEPGEGMLEDQRTFECVQCAYAETVVVQLS
jgi:hypothetical protein